MSIQLSDNIQIGQQLPIDNRYFDGYTPWADEAAVKVGIPKALRFKGLTVNINGVEYWFKDDIEDIDLVVKSVDLPTKTSDLINDGEDGTNAFITLQDLPPSASTLTEVLVNGRNTGGRSILVNDADAIELENGSLIRKGTYDFGGFGDIIVSGITNAGDGFIQTGIDWGDPSGTKWSDLNGTYIKTSVAVTPAAYGFGDIGMHTPEPGTFNYYLENPISNGVPNSSWNGIAYFLAPGNKCGWGDPDDDVTTDPVVNYWRLCVLSDWPSVYFTNPSSDPSNFPTSGWVPIDDTIPNSEGGYGYNYIANYDSGFTADISNIISGNGGISRICAVGYEDMWQAGVRYVFGNTGTIRHATNGFTVIPDSSFDYTKRFAVGSLWTLDNGDTYECTNADLNAAVWVLVNTGTTPTLQQINDDSGLRAQSPNGNSYLELVLDNENPSFELKADTGSKQGAIIINEDEINIYINDGANINNLDLLGDTIELKNKNLASGKTNKLIIPQSDNDTDFSLPTDKATGSYILATTIDVENAVPYTGATQDVDLGLFDITAAHIIKDGGQPEQFLKADGSVDNNIYLTSADLPSTLDLYATTTASDVPGYGVLVRNISDGRFNTTAQDVTTPVINGTAIACGSLITDLNIISGNPGVFNFTVSGNIRKISGPTASQAEFYFRIYKRVSAGTETLISESAKVLVPNNSGSYALFTTVALWNDGIFLSTDRIVLKFYGDLAGTGSGGTYQFQFGGIVPVRGSAAIPTAVLPNIYLKDLADVENVDPIDKEILYWNDTASLWEHSLAKDLIPDATATEKGLVNGTNLKTVAGQSLFGTGNIPITTISTTRQNANNSTNPNINYCGVALGQNIPTTNIAWTIKKLTISAAGVPVVTTTTVPVKWVDREAGTTIYS